MNFVDLTITALTFIQGQWWSIRLRDEKIKIDHIIWLFFLFLHVQHLPNASFANATMMSARWPICFASCAYRPFVLIIVVVLARMQIGEIQTILWQGHGARITEHRLQMGHGQQEHHRVEQHNVNGSPSTAKHTNKHNQFIIHWLALIKCIDRIASTFPWSWSLTCSALSAW